MKLKSFMFSTETCPNGDHPLPGQCALCGFERQQGDVALATLEQTALFVATVTGVKQQLVDAGWDERHAELATIEALRSRS